MRPSRLVRFIQIWVVITVVGKERRFGGEKEVRKQITYEGLRGKANKGVYLGEFRAPIVICSIRIKKRELES